MIKKEIYKDIQGYEGLYQVSNYGNIKSLPKFKKHSEGHYFLTKEKIIKGGVEGGGYYQVQLFKEGFRKPIKVHQLVAISFLGHLIDGYKKVVNHKDYNKLNNNVDNLEIVTQRENSNKKHINSSSKYVGVHWCNTHNRWVSRIVINKKTCNLGYYKNELEASLSYQKQLDKLKINNKQP